MILVDSSVFIEYYRADGSDKIKDVIKEAIYHDLVAINGIIMVEVLSGISHKSDFEKVKSDFKGFHFLPLSEKEFIDASLLGSKLRAKGKTVPSTDLIIASSAINNDAVLYHLDKHFDIIAKYSSLKSERMIR
ncbi:MAG: PIN domain nuclease [Nitrospirae bacterium]|nr:MAG: PIN domain nuclease [Nitrospirota bacterium]